MTHEAYSVSGEYFLGRGSVTRVTKRWPSGKPQRVDLKDESGAVVNVATICLYPNGCPILEEA